MIRKKDNLCSNKQGFQKTVIRPIKDTNILMRINKVLSTKYVLSVFIVFLSIVIFLSFNYLLNVALNIPQMLINSNDAYSYIGLQSIFIFHSGYLAFFYIFVLLLIIIVDIRFILSIRVSWKDLNVGQKGTERFATLDEIKKQYRAIPEKDIEYEGKSGFPISNYKDKIFIDDGPVNNLVIGITRSGKGETKIKPFIDIISRSSEKASMIVSDPKLELFKSSYQTLKNRGYDVYLLNLIDPRNSMGYNPLSPIIELYKDGKYAEAELLSKSLAYAIFCATKSTGEDKFWDSSAAFATVALFLGLIHDCLEKDKELTRVNRVKAIEEMRKEVYDLLDEQGKIIYKKMYLSRTKPSKKELAVSINKSEKTVYRHMKSIDKEIDKGMKNLKYETSTLYEKKITLSSAAHMFSVLSSQKVDSDKTALDMYFLKRPPNDRARFNYSSIQAAGDRTKGSILSMTLSQINSFSVGTIANLTSINSLNLTDIGFSDKPIAVFLGIDMLDSSNSYIANMFIKQTCFMLSKKAALSEETRGKCKRKVHFILDEMGNIPAIDDMDRYITAGLGLNLYFTLVIQSFNQLKTLYGDKAATIRANCGNLIYLLAADTETTDEFSKLIGTETITNVSRNGRKFSLDKNFTESYEEKPLINPVQLGHILQGESVVKRFIKRTDLKGRDIESTPIFNRDKTRAKFVYQYLNDTFPSDTTFKNLDFKSDTNITAEELNDRTFDVNIRKIKSTPVDKFVINDKD